MLKWKWEKSQQEAENGMKQNCSYLSRLLEEPNQLQERVNDDEI